MTKREDERQKSHEAGNDQENATEKKEDRTVVDDFYDDITQTANTSNAAPRGPQRGANYPNEDTVPVPNEVSGAETLDMRCPNTGDRLGTNQQDEGKRGGKTDVVCCKTLPYCNRERETDRKESKYDQVKETGMTKARSDKEKLVAGSCEDTPAKLDLDNFDRPEFGECPYILTSPRSLQACKHLALKVSCC